ncbi:50S ribosomal protein L11 [Candidatus Micrarchaeota archaeon]|nr:MAG: 50S ribosomal protein L11 [Candidatus Micrarchaeota archaeon]
MTEKIINALIEGGKASAGPPIGPALGPLGINAGEVVAEINKKTASFAGVTVPVKIIVDTVKKTFRIEVGTPPTSALIKKELGIEKGSGKAKDEKVGDISIDELIKISFMKKDALHGKSARARLKEVIGTCVTMGILVDGKDPREVQKEVDEGKYDAKLEGKEALKELSEEEKKARMSKYVKEKKEEAEEKKEKKKKR